MAKFRIEIISPTHIGSGKRLDPNNFVVLGNTCYVINEDKLFRELLLMDRKNNRYLKEFTQQIENSSRSRRSDQFPLKSFLRMKRLDNHVFLEKICEYKLNADHEPGNEIQAIIKDAFSRPYIPGSSLKGMFRTAVIFNYFMRLKTESPELFKQKFLDHFDRSYEEYTRAQGWKKRKALEYFFQSVEETIFQGYTFPKFTYYDKRRRTKVRKSNCPNTDIFRALKVSDASLINDSNLDLSMLYLYKNLKGDFVLDNSKTHFAETIPQGAQFEFEMSIDQAILNDFNKYNPSTEIIFSNISDIVQASDKFIFQHALAEVDFYKGIHSEKPIDFVKFFNTFKPNARIGGGTSLTHKSLILLLDRDYRDKMLDMLRSQDSVNVFPKTRKFASVNNMKGYSQLPPGWFVMSIVQNV